MDDLLGRFDLATDEVVVGPLRLTITRPRSAEDLIDEAEYERDERLPVLGRAVAERPGARRAPRRARPARALRVVELGLRRRACPRSSPRSSAPTSLATDWYARRPRVHRAPTPPRRATAVATLLVDWTDPPPELLAMPRRRPRRRRGRPLRGAQRPGPRRPWCPGCSPPAASSLIADPRRPHAAGLLDRSPTAAGRSRTTDVRHGGRLDESGPDRASAPLDGARPPRLESLQRVSDTLARERSSVAQW